MARLMLLLIVLSGLLSMGMGIFIFLFPGTSAEWLAWGLQKLCDLPLGRRC